MDTYYCAHGHQAPTIGEARSCRDSSAASYHVGWSATLAAPSLPSPRHEGSCPQTYNYRGTRQRFIIKVDPDGPPTDNQIWKVNKSGGDEAYAKTLTKQQCSDYIDRLLYPEDYEGASAALVTEVVVPVSNEPTLVPLDLLGAIPDGRFAVRADETEPWTFLRLTRPTRGNFAGFLKVQTQHSDSYMLGMTVSPKAQLCWYQPKRELEPKLLILIADWKWAAICYTREIGRCCRCGRELTHEESLKYGIGPECVKHWPWIPEEVEIREGQS